jgi:GNAT superfamily N-acetyltransferase
MQRSVVLLTPDRLGDANQLPKRFAFPRAGARGPLLAPEPLILECCAPAIGDAVLVRSHQQLYWRRVMGIEGDLVRTRREVSPFDDPVPVASLARLASPDPARLLWRLAPHSVAHAIWRAAWLRARVAPKPRLSPLAIEVASLPATHPLVERFLREAYDLRWAAYLYDHEGVLHLHARDDDGSVVGRTLVTFSGDESYAHEALVKHRVRGRGVGRRLLCEAVAAARARGARTMQSHINARNIASLRAATAAGLVSTGRWWATPGAPLEAAELQLLEVRARLV